jgi:hypothetical protein
VTVTKSAQVPADSLVISPSRTRLAKATRTAMKRGLMWLVVSAAFATGIAIKVGITVGATAEAAVVILAAAGFGFSVMTEPRVTLFRSSTTFGRSDRLGRLQSYELSEVAAVERLRVRSSRFSSRSVLIVSSKAGKAILSVVEDVWEPEDITRFLSGLPVAVRNHADAEFSVAQVARRFPGAFPKWASHPTAMGVTVGILLVAVTVGVLLLAGFHPTSMGG